MTGTVNGTSGTGVSGQGRRRARQPVPHTRRVEFTLSGEEYAVLAEAAGRAGMARRAYAAQAALTAAANGNPVSGQEPLALNQHPARGTRPAVAGLLVRSRPPRGTRRSPHSGWLASPSRPRTPATARW
jgi:hypothetical protein